MIRRIAAVAGVLFAVGLAVLVPAHPAAAHGQLLATVPANGQRVAVAPAEVRLTFSERVFLTTRAFRVLNGKTEVRLDRPAMAGAAVVQPLPAGLRPGAYTVLWRVVSADSHPIHGAFVFVVGDGPAATAPAAGAVDEPGGAVPVGYAVARWLAYAALALLVGGAAVLLLSWAAGWDDPWIRRLTLIGWAGSLGMAVAVLPLQAVYTAGVLGADALRDTLTTDFGRFLGARVVLLLIGGGLLWAAAGAHRRGGRRSVPAWTAACAVVLGLALPAAWIGAGHANAELTVAGVLASVAHLTSVSLWLGGLVALLLLTRRVREVPAAALASVAVGFSRLAGTAVAVLAVSGLYRAWVGVGSVAALAGSTYGRLLVFKVALLGVVLWFAAMSRTVVRRWYARRAGDPPTRLTRSERDAEEQSRRRLRWSVRAEAGVAALVLALAAVLVATPPGSRPAPAATAPATRSVDLAVGDGRARLRLDPARVGASTLGISLRDGRGRAWDVPEVTAALRLDVQDIGPLPVTLVRSATGEYRSDGLSLPAPGEWKLTLRVRTSEIDRVTVDAVLPVV